MATEYKVKLFTLGINVNYRYGCSDRHWRANSNIPIDSNNENCLQVICIFFPHCLSENQETLSMITKSKRFDAFVRADFPYVKVRAPNEKWQKHLMRKVKIESFYSGSVYSSLLIVFSCHFRNYLKKNLVSGPKVLDDLNFVKHLILFRSWYSAEKMPEKTEVFKFFMSTIRPSHELRSELNGKCCF